MYTSCPECGTVFRISIQDLRVAEGYARCGHCSATFNALATLADEPPPTVTLNQLVLPTEPQPPLPPAGDDTLEFDIPEDSWTNFFEKDMPAVPAFKAAAPAAEQEPASTPEPELENVDDLEPELVDEQEPGFEAALEPAPAAGPEHDIGTGIGSETVDQVGLYRALSAESAHGGGQEGQSDPLVAIAHDEDLDAELDAGLDTEQDAGDNHTQAAADGTTPPIDDWESLLGEVGSDDPELEPVYVIGEEPPAAQPEDNVAAAITASPAEPPPEPLHAAPAATADLEDPLGAPLELADAWDESVLDRTATPAPLPADFAAHLGMPEQPADSAPPAMAVAVAVADQPFVWRPPVQPPEEHPLRRRLYATGAVLLVLVLAAQLIHQNRDRLATYPALTEPMTRLYAALGLPLWPAWDLRAYEVRQYEAVADRTSVGALDILARIAVVGNEPVGLPMVRIKLTDRFGKPVGTRVFKPAEYLGNNPQPREPLSPGTMIPVELHLNDPGSDAQGIKIDVCLMNRRSGMVCRADQDPFAA